MRPIFNAAVSHGIESVFGSFRIQTGGGQAKILETRVLAIFMVYTVEWKGYSLDLNELARLRWTRPMQWFLN